jgi:hypothetical protein
MLLWKRFEEEIREGFNRCKMGEMKGEEKCNWKNGLPKMLLRLLYVVFIHAR